MKIFRFTPRIEGFAHPWRSVAGRWWPDGIDTPGIVLIKVSGTRAHYWDGEDEGEVQL